MAAEAVQSYFYHDNYLLPAAEPQGVVQTSQSDVIAKVLKLEETPLVSDVARLVADYAIPKIDHFGAEEWMRYYGVDVGREADLPEKFYTWWLSSDVIDPDKLNCETHLPPVLRPQYVRKAALNIPLTLDTLGYLAQYPKEGPPSQYTFNSEALQQHGNTKAGPARWLVMRKDIFARNQSYDQQKECIQKLNTTGADYDEVPSALDLATIVFATHVRTGGDRYLGNTTGKEGCWTFSRCKEHAQYGKDSYPLVIGDFAPGGLIVSHNDYAGNENCGVAALRKF